MPHQIGDHALLADGRTAALIDPQGNVAWLCWPNVDSMPCLLALLDEEQGGSFSVRPAGIEAQVASRRYHAGSLVLETVWRRGGASLVVDDALAWNGPRSLVRRLRSIDRPVDVEVRFAPAFDAARARARLRVEGTRIVATAGAQVLVLEGAPSWRVELNGAVARFTVAPMAPVILALCDAPMPVSHDLIDDTLREWRGMTAHLRPRPSALATRVLDADTHSALLRTSAAVLLGLEQRDGGMVAAPTTSLPQWPASSRTWDYRYCWMRDASLAGIALWRAGLHDAALRLGAFLGEAVLEHGPRPVYRVDGGPPPPEQTLDHLRGHGGARPVRVGNAAAEQVQIDAPAALIEFSWTLAAHHALPDPLQRATPVCAAWLAQRGGGADHGIWEIRGEPRAYTHSRAVASAALRGAAGLVERGVISGDAAAWRTAGAALRARILDDDPPVLQLRDDGGGADAALALMGHVGFLHDGPLLRDTLALIETRLDHGGLLDRYEGQPDDIADPCAPFVFPTFWMAEALQAIGEDGTAHLRAALSCRGPLDLFGEVADPTTHAPLGNYPQVQSHAALINTILA